jgi:hypothetical protein
MKSIIGASTCRAETPRLGDRERGGQALRNLIRKRTEDGASSSTGNLPSTPIMATDDLRTPQPKRRCAPCPWAVELHGLFPPFPLPATNRDRRCAQV